MAEEKKTIDSVQSLFDALDDSEQDAKTLECSMDVLEASFGVEKKENISKSTVNRLLMFMKAHQDQLPADSLAEFVWVHRESIGYNSDNQILFLVHSSDDYDKATQIKAIAGYPLVATMHDANYCICLTP